MRLPTFKSTSPGLANALNVLARAIESVYGSSRVSIGGNLLGHQGVDGISIEGYGEAGDASPTVYLPWDLFSQEAASETTLTCKFWPGNMGGIIPTEMFQEFTVSTESMQYLVVHVTAANGAVQSCTLTIEGSHPAGQEHTLGAPPATFDWLVGVFVEGNYYNIAKKNLVVTPRETQREDNPSATPYGLPYQSYFIWGVS